MNPCAKCNGTGWMVVSVEGAAVPGYEQSAYSKTVFASTAYQPCVCRNSPMLDAELAKPREGGHG